MLVQNVTEIYFTYFLLIIKIFIFGYLLIFYQQNTLNVVQRTLNQLF